MSAIRRYTEEPSSHRHLELKSSGELLLSINSEDQKVAPAVGLAIPQIEACVSAILPKMRNGGRLFYLGAGTSGRLGIVDASECPPTFGVPFGLVIGIIAGGDTAIRRAVEFAEDDTEQGWIDLLQHAPDAGDSLIGIAAGGTTPYVIGAVKKAREAGLITGCITCNEGTPLAAAAEFPIEIVVGPEFLTGSTRMKSGTAQKMALNMISTSLMIGLGRVQDNRMVDMQLTNNKLVDRGTRMIMEKLDLDYEKANILLKQFGSVRNAIEQSNR